MHVYNKGAKTVLCDIVWLSLVSRRKEGMHGRVNVSMHTCMYAHTGTTVVMLSPSVANFFQTVQFFTV